MKKILIDILIFINTLFVALTIAYLMHGSLETHPTEEDQSAVAVAAVMLILFFGTIDFVLVLWRVIIAIKGRLKNASIFKQNMWIGCFLSFVFLLINYALYKITQLDFFLTIWITALTFFYHLAMRLFVGGVVGYTTSKIKIDYNNKWFQQRPIEKTIYSWLNVKKWKHHMPTYNPDSYSLENNSIEEIIYTMCGSELVHECIIVASFVPLLFSIPFGDLEVFLVTSILAACIDFVFVIMQRYNRPRLVAMMRRKL